MDKIDDKIYRFDGECYKYKANAIKCENDTDYIDFE